MIEEAAIPERADVSVGFWRRLPVHGDAPAIIDSNAGRYLSYKTLGANVEEAAARLLRKEKQLLFLYAQNDVDGVICYLAALQAQHSTYLSSIAIDHPASADLTARYRPDLILRKSGRLPASIASSYREMGEVCGYRLASRKEASAPLLHNDLALVLATSGSTGSAKLVRLSWRNLMVSGSQVAEALGITSRDRGLLSLPFAHAYGLSILNSHLRAGAAIVISRHSPGDRAFWNLLMKERVSSLAGVSVVYDLLRASNVDVGSATSLRMVTHAGDALPARTFSWLYDTFSPKGVEIYLMYGQTEACGRISVLPPALLPQKSRSVGRAVYGGGITTSPDHEILFCGPNVMLGYATDRSDLALGGVMGGQLRTGDVGYLDDDGLLFVTGRLNRYCKVFGQRMYLDDIEAYFGDLGPTAALCHDGVIFVYSEAPEEVLRARLPALVKWFRVPPQCVQMKRVRSIPRTASGKIAYRALPGVPAVSDVVGTDN